MSAASLTIRIAADLNSFSRDLRKMTKEVDAAAKDIASVGAALTLGVTVPVGLALGALAKMGAENEQTAARMRRSFGPATEEVSAALTQLMKVVPETGDALSAMAIDMNDIAGGMGFGNRQARELSKSMLKMAADVGAFRNVSMGEALTGLQKGLQGQTRGLKDLGISLDATDVKQEAYRLGLLRTGQELTPLGTALSTYSLLVQRTGQMTGEATRRQMDISRQWAFIKRDVVEIADRLSNLLVPALRTLTGMARVVVGAISELPTAFWVVTGSVAALAAAIGPLMVVSSGLVAAFFKLQAAIKLLVAADALPKLIMLLRTIAKDPRVIATLLAIAGVATLATWAYSKFKKEVEDTSGMTDGLADVKDLLGGVTSDLKGPLDSIKQLKDRTQAVMGAWSQAIDIGPAAGGTANAMANEMISLNERILHLYSLQKDKTSEVARELGQMLLDTREMLNLQGGVSGLFGGPQSSGLGVKIASRMGTPDQRLKEQITGDLIQQETSLRLREMLIALPPAFQATRVAVLEFAESMRAAQQEFQLAIAGFKNSWQSSNITGGLMAGLQAGLAPIIASFTPMSLAMLAVAKVFQGLQPVLDAFMEPLVIVGKILGIMITPILKVLFEPLKALAIIVAFLGEILARVSAGIATAIGRAIVGIGKFLNLLPGSIGNPLIAAGRAMLQYAKSQYETADRLHKAQKEIARMRFGDTADEVMGLGEAARETAEALLNVPSGFKLALERFNATAPAPISYAPPRPLGGGSGAGPGAGGDGGGGVAPVGGGQSAIIQVVVDGKVLARAMLRNLQDMSQAQYGSTARWAEVQG